MLAWRMILVATTLVPVITVAGCGPQQPPGPAADHGLCYQQAGCGGGSLLELPTLNECKAAGGKELDRCHSKKLHKLLVERARTGSNSARPTSSAWSSASQQPARDKVCVANHC